MGVVCLVCASGFGALAASSASAALPELGRCVKLATKTGLFTGEKCIGTSKTHVGEYEFEAGPGAKKGVKESFTGKLETTTGEVISCTAIQLFGEYTGAKSEKFTKFIGTGCENVTHHTSCYSNPVTPSKIESETALVGALGFIPGSKGAIPWAGWDLAAESSSTAIVMFFCGEAKGLITFNLEGSVIGHATKTGTMVSSFGLTFKQTAGVQLVTGFIGGPEDVLQLAELPFGGTEMVKHQAALAGVAELTDEEALEIKNKI
jgi:hypothetical protein